jgi:hypothetical protein
MTTARQRKAIYTRAAEGVLCEGWYGVFSAVLEVKPWIMEVPELEQVLYHAPPWRRLPSGHRAMLLLLAAAMCDD